MVDEHPCVRAFSLVLVPSCILSWSGILAVGCPSVASCATLVSEPRPSFFRSWDVLLTFIEEFYAFNLLIAMIVLFSHWSSLGCHQCSWALQPQWVLWISGLKTALHHVTIAFPLSSLKVFTNSCLDSRYFVPFQSTVHPAQLSESGKRSCHHRRMKSGSSCQRSRRWLCLGSAMDTTLDFSTINARKWELTVSPWRL